MRKATILILLAGCILLAFGGIVQAEGKTKFDTYWNTFVDMPKFEVPKNSSVGKGEFIIEKEHPHVTGQIGYNRDNIAEILYKIGYEQEQHLFMGQLYEDITKQYTLSGKVEPIKTSRLTVLTQGSYTRIKTVALGQEEITRGYSFDLYASYRVNSNLLFSNRFEALGVDGWKLQALGTGLEQRLNTRNYLKLSVKTTNFDSRFLEANLTYRHDFTSQQRYLVDIKASSTNVRVMNYFETPLTDHLIASGEVVNNSRASYADWLCGNLYYLNSDKFSLKGEYRHSFGPKLHMYNISGDCKLRLFTNSYLTLNYDKRNYQSDWLQVSPSSTVKCGLSFGL